MKAQTPRNWSGVAMVVSWLVLAGCAAQPSAPAQPPYPPVPAVKAEKIPLPPVSEDPLVWQPGHWDWNGSTYTWQPGKWVPRAGHGTMWQDGYWAKKDNTWSWVPAHWE
ncbi:MAG: hypothetical protein K6U10_12020 [Acidobacteriia bacterium]|nr:YXWGXW repeat-containing protein [Methyloceanibacter sp.]MBX5471574.1 YXWGXW repeat-containing protein [Acetobacteraceae bacterium]MCL6492528.1 hypothetical protein [Terriglobia bacterium]